MRHWLVLILKDHSYGIWQMKYCLTDAATHVHT